MRVGLFGGSFDPPHEGHLQPVEAAREALGLERVLFLPTAVPPHKDGPRHAPALARYAMVELALLDREGLFASTFELVPERPAYTIDTLDHFLAIEPETDFVLLIGGDSFASFHTWRRWREIAARVPLGVLARAGWEEQKMLDAAVPEVRALAENGRATLVRGPRLPYSSTDIRSALAAGQAPLEGALPELVIGYIRKYSLYR